MARGLDRGTRRVSMVRLACRSAASTIMRKLCGCSWSCPVPACVPSMRSARRAAPRDRCEEAHLPARSGSCAVALAPGAQGPAGAARRIMALPVPDLAASLCTNQREAARTGALQQPNGWSTRPCLRAHGTACHGSTAPPAFFDATQLRCSCGRGSRPTAPARSPGRSSVSPVSGSRLSRRRTTRIPACRPSGFFPPAPSLRKGSGSQKQRNNGSGNAPRWELP
jgi:hypothetical protein